MSEEIGYISREKLFLALVANDAFSNVPELMSILDEDTFLEFVEIFGGQTIVVPKMEDIAIALRDVSIQERHEQGVKIRDLADQHGLTDRHVRRIIATVKQAKNHGAQTGVGENA